MTRISRPDPLDRLVNPSWAFLPLGRARVHLPFLLFLGLITYASARHGLESLLIWLAVAFLMWGWPLLANARARRGHYSWMCPEVTRGQLKRALAAGGVSADEHEREVLAYLAEERSLTYEYAVETLMQTTALPILTKDGREERKAALTRLIDRDLVKRDKKAPDLVKLELKPLAPLAYAALQPGAS